MKLYFAFMVLVVAALSCQNENPVTKEKTKTTPAVTTKAKVKAITNLNQLSDAANPLYAYVLETADHKTDSVVLDGPLPLLEVGEEIEVVSETGKIKTIKKSIPVYDGGYFDPVLPPHMREE